MRLLAAIIISGLLLWAAEKPLKKHSSFFYYGAAALSAAGYWIPEGVLPGWLYQGIQDYITSGTWAAALFVIVMYAVLLPKKSRLFRCFMSNRGEIAILGTLLVLDHMAYYGAYFVRRVLVQKHTLAAAQVMTVSIAVLLILLVVPLTVTSFKVIRRKMKPRSWKRLQRLSYLFYGLVYLHVAVVLYPSAASGDWLRLADLIVYSLIFGAYAALRIGKYLQKKKKEQYRPAVWGAVALVFFAGILSLIPGFGGGSALARQGAEATQTAAQDESRSEGYADGTWRGEGMGFNGMVTVDVVIENGEITAVKIMDREDDDPYFTNAKEGIVPQILERQSADVDAVTGASYSSEGIITAVSNALEQAAENAP